MDGPSNNTICIGNSGSRGLTNSILIGAGQSSTFIAGIYNITSPSGVPVYVNTNGQLGTLTSSRRFKDNIADMNASSETVLKLRPVTFNYKTGIDPAAIPQFGLIAEEVDKVDPKLVVRDDKGEIYTVRYEAVNAMLLNEFIKEHKKVEEHEKHLSEQKQINSDQNKRIDALEARLAELAAQFEERAK
jgi:hypothetical protein